MEPARLRPGRRAPRPSAAVAGHIDGLDGLRGFAVLAVIAFHLWPNRVPGGFLGVDVFFVISGFLITTLLLREHHRTGHVDLPAFWVRRARRLLPALATVVVTSVVVASAVDPDLVVGIGRQTVGALTFSSNWLEVRAGSDYFDETAPVLFQTFWSLAVEEQFYLVWPVVFLGMVAVVRRSVDRVRVAAGLAVSSAVLMGVLFAPGTNPTRVYYGTDTHLFGLMIGAGLAFAFAGEVGVLAHRRWQRLRVWLGYVALVGLLAMMSSIDSADALTYRGAIFGASLLTGIVVAALPGEPTAFTRLHRLRPLAWIGERSYGIYLWHWPVILVVTALRPATAPGADPAAVTVVVALVSTFALSALMYRWIEMPVRRLGFRTAGSRLWTWLHAVGGRPSVVPRLAAAAAAVALVATVATAIGDAPGESAAQRAVERGQLAIAAQSATTAPEVDALTSSAPMTTTSMVPVASPPTSAPTTTAPTPAWPIGQAEPPGQLMSGFGDSVLSGAAPAVYARFPGVFLDAEPIRQWRDAPAVIRDALDDGVLRPVVVLNFGTNAGLVSDESRQALATVLDLLGPDRRVVLVNTVGVSRWVPSTNDTLAGVSAQHPNTIVADWHAAVVADPSLLHSDRTHPNTRGIRVYAEVVAAALATLGPV